MDECIIKYHHGGTLLRAGEVKYVNGSEVDFAVDPDKLCYWDMLGDMQDLGYNIPEKISFCFVDDGKVVNNICNDQDTIALCDHIRRHCVVDVYVEHGLELGGNKKNDIAYVELGADRENNDATVNFGGNNGKNDAIVDLDLDDENEECAMELVPNRENEEAAMGMDPSMENENDHDGSNNHDSGYEEEDRLVDAPFVDYVSDIDEERKQSRDIMSKYIKFKKSMQDDERTVMRQILVKHVEKWKTVINL